MAKYYTFILLLFFGIKSNAQLIVDSTQKIDFLVNNVLIAHDDTSVFVENIKFTGSDRAIGLTNNVSRNLLPEKLHSSNMLFIRAILLATGDVTNAIGPNHSERKSSILNEKGDVDLNTITKGKTIDASVLEFDFTPQTDSISFRYIFASEEYNEYVGSKYNDVFGFFVSGPGIVGKRNLAVLPFNKNPVTVNSINFLDNKTYYIDNKASDKENSDMYQDNSAKLSYVLQYDGMTVPLKAECAVIPHKRYHIKIAIADVSDALFDSGVFLEAASFTSKSSTKFEKLVEKAKKQELLVDIPKDKNISYSIIDSSRINIIMNIEFAHDSYIIPDSAYKLINVVNDILKDNSEFNLEIHGHTNNLGKDEYNQVLSEQRAQSIYTYMLSQKIEQSRLTYKGFGPSKPIADNSTEQGRALNRRVEFLLKKVK